MYNLRFFILLFILPFLGAAAKEGENPLKITKEWFEEEKQKSEENFHRFATLATVDEHGRPHTRVMEIAKINQKKGFFFFTHKDTTKVSHMSLHSDVAFNIYLPKTHRQISMIGTVKELTTQEAEKSWKKMPRFLKISFLASKHHGLLPSLDDLLERIEKIKQTYRESDIPMPDTFVGFCFSPQESIFYEILPNHLVQKKLVKLGDRGWNSFYLEP